MSVLEIYINWVNSVLGEAGGHVDGVEAVQDGKVLCELIDVLAPDAGLLAKVKATGDCTPLAYINTALEHMRSHGIRIKFPSEDIVHNEIKSMLDVLWMLILNYGIHHIGQNAFQRTVGIGKKNLLEWCQEELEADFDHRNTLSFNLCSGNWFLKLLEKVAGCSMQKSEDKAEYIDTLLLEIQDRYLIMKDIIKAHDIVDGTVDEHTLMIYLSLLKRRVSNSGRHSRREMLSTDGKAAAMAKIHYFEKRARSLSNESQRSHSAESVSGRAEKRHRSPSNGRSNSASSGLAKAPRSISLYDQVFGDGNETSDWSSTGSLFSGKEKLSPMNERSPQNPSPVDDVLLSTISDRVSEHLPLCSGDAEKETVSQRISEKETDTQTKLSKTPIIKPRTSTKGRLSPQTKEQVSHSSSQRLLPTILPEKDTRSSSPSRHTRTLLSEKGRISSTKDRSISPSITIQDEDRIIRVESSVSPPSQRSHYTSPPPKRQTELEVDRAARTLASPVNFPDHREPREQSHRISIKRPKDYIRQWEDTMDRLSTSSLTDSPRQPLISSYANNSRSKSFEATSTSNVRRPPYSPRSRSNDVVPNVPSTRSRSPRSRSPSSQAVQSSDSQPAISSDQSLQSILDRLPIDMRQKAQNASKFLMHTSGPEVMNLINVIKLAREESFTGNIRNSDFEQTYPKREESSPSGARVRFQQPIHHSGGAQSEISRPVPILSSSPRGMSSSPQRRRTFSSSGVEGDGERGTDRMLSVSPRDRSRSLSPRSVSAENRVENLNARSPKPQDMSTGDSRPLREELLFTNLGMNSRVVEDERPSLRLLALTSSPRTEGSLGSPTRVCLTSPLKPTTTYPEVTRLELGLDSDRSYASQTKDLNEESPRPARRGGAGRVPRREAWEHQRRKNADIPQAITVSDSVGQSKFIEVLCKEIKLLKQKVEVMEEEEGRRSRSRPSRSPNARGNSRLTVNNEMVYTSRPSSCSVGRDRSTSCPLLRPSSRSVILKSSPRRTSGAASVGSTSVDRSVGTYPSMSVSNPGVPRAVSPRTLGRVGLGYQSPDRSTTPDILDHDLDTSIDLSPEKQQKWKQLISIRDLSEAEVIELKQALACAVVENDILQAKLNNARHEIHDKLRHTNEVLDDCRRHLAKSQAENMELRTRLEQEKQRSEEFESRIKDLQNSVSKVRVDNQHLEVELGQTNSRLDRSIQETKPGVEALKAENSRLITRLAQAETQNDSLTDQMDNLKHNQTKAMNTIDELRECLHKARRERQELFEEVTTLRQQEQASRVREIISSYQEKGAKDEREHELNSARQSLDNSLDIGKRSFSDDNPFRPFKSVDDSFRSPRQSRPRRSSSQHSYLSQDELSPTNSREIYPHRSSYQPSRSRSCSPRAKRSSPSRVLSSCSLDASFIDQTLQEIENDMMKERQNYMSKNTPSARRRLNLSSYSSEENLTSIKTRSPRYFSTSPSRSPDRSGYETDSALKYSYSTPTKKSSTLKPISNTRSQSLDRADDDSLCKRSDSSSPSRFSARPSILKSLERRRDRSPSYTRASSRDVLGNRSLTSGTSTPERSNSPIYFPRGSHSPPTRLSPEPRQEDKKPKSTISRRPLHSKTGPGQIARSLQREFDKEDKMLNALAKSSVFQNKSWFEMQSDSDDGDTGINSSMSSRSSFEKLAPARKKTPLLTEEQKRYADELIEKYTRAATSV